MGDACTLSRDCRGSRSSRGGGTNYSEAKEKPPLLKYAHALKFDDAYVVIDANNAAVIGDISIYETARQKAEEFVKEHNAVYIVCKLQPVEKLGLVVKSMKYPGVEDVKM